MKRTASAVWHGDLKQGKGTLTSQGGVLNDTQYSFKSRFEEGPGTNPEELIAAAHAGCFAMQLSALLSEEGYIADDLTAKATLTMDFIEGVPTITTIHLDLTAGGLNIDAAKFQEFATKAKAVCPVSRVLKAEISLDAKLV